MKMEKGAMTLPRNRKRMTGSDAVIDDAAPSLRSAPHGNQRRRRGGAPGLSVAVKWALACLIVTVSVGMAIGVC